MLELRPNCECCDRDLPPQSPDARICTFECTFCADSRRRRARRRLSQLRRQFRGSPIRPAAMLKKYPASACRVLKAEGCAGGQGGLNSKETLDDPW